MGFRQTCAISFASAANAKAFSRGDAIPAVSVISFRMKTDTILSLKNLPVLTYSLTETAYVLGLNPCTVYALVHRGILKPLPGLRHKRISKIQVHRYAEGESL